MSSILASILFGISVLTIMFVLVQNKGAGLSSTFGGGNEVYLTKRGVEKWVINLTVVLIVSFCVVRLLAFYY